MGDDRVPRSEVCAVQLGRGPAPEEALRGVGKEVRRSHRRRSKICARLQRSWPRVGGSGALRRCDQTISQGRCAVGGDRVPRPEACAAQLGLCPALEEALRGGGKEVRRSHRRRSEIMRSLTTILASRWQARSASTPRSSNIARPLRYGRRPGPPTGSLRCATGPRPCGSKNLYEEAAKKYGEAIAVDPNYAPAYNGLGVALAGQERFDDAIEQYRKAAALWESTGSPDRKFALRYWGEALRLKKLYEESAKKCGEAIAVDPNFADAYNDLGLALADQERFDEAIEQYRKAAAQWGSISRPEVCAAQLGRRPAFEEALRGVGKEVRRSHRRRSEIMRALITVLASRWRTRNASTRRSSNIARPLRCGRRPGLPTGSLRCTTGPTPWTRRSSTRSRQGSTAKPSSLMRILRTLINGLGLALAGQERFDEAIEQYRQAAALWETTGSPDRKFALRNWARALGSKKLYEEAGKEVRRSHRRRSKFCARLQRSWLSRWRARSASTNAIEQFRQADGLWENAKSDDRKFALWNLGMAFLQQDRFDDAIANFAQATTVAPDDAKAFFYYGVGLTACWRYRDGYRTVRARRLAGSQESRPPPQ